MPANQKILISSLIPVSDDSAEKNPDDSTDKKQLEPVKTVETSENAENTSIFDQPVFPRITKPVSFTPKDVKEALKEYAQTMTPLSVCLHNHGIRDAIFYDRLVSQFQEIRSLYDIARKQKARQYGAAQQKIIEELPQDDVMYTMDKMGHKSLSNAAVQLIKIRSEVYNRLAQQAETGSYVPANRQENVNRNLNIGVQLTGKLPDNFDLAETGPDALLGVLKNRK